MWPPPPLSATGVVGSVGVGVGNTTGVAAANAREASNTPAPQLSDALVSVSERRAEAAQLRELEGWSNKQIARHLGVHPSTVGRWFGTDTKEETP